MDMSPESLRETLSRPVPSTYVFWKHTEIAK